MKNYEKSLVPFNGQIFIETHTYFHSALSTNITDMNIELDLLFLKVSEVVSYSILLFFL